MGTDPKQISIDPLADALRPLRDILAASGQVRSQIVPQAHAPFYSGAPNVWDQLYGGTPEAKAAAASRNVNQSYMTPPTQPPSMFSNDLMGILAKLLPYFTSNPNPGTPGGYTPPPTGGGGTTPGTTPPPTTPPPATSPPPAGEPLPPGYVPPGGGDPEETPEGGTSPGDIVIDPKNYTGNLDFGMTKDRPGGVDRLVQDLFKKYNGDKEKMIQGLKDFDNVAGTSLATELTTAPSKYYKSKLDNFLQKGGFFWSDPQYSSFAKTPRGQFDQQVLARLAEKGYTPQDSFMGKADLNYATAQTDTIRYAGTAMLLEMEMRKRAGQPIDEQLYNDLLKDWKINGLGVDPRTGKPAIISGSDADVEKRLNDYWGKSSASQANTTPRSTRPVATTVIYDRFGNPVAKPPELGPDYELPANTPPASESTVNWYNQTPVGTVNPITPTAAPATTATTATPWHTREPSTSTAALNPVPAPVQVPTVQTSQPTFQASTTGTSTIAPAVTEAITAILRSAPTVTSGSRMINSTNSEVNPVGIQRYKYPELL